CAQHTHSSILPAPASNSISTRSLHDALPILTHLTEKAERNFSRAGFSPLHPRLPHQGTRRTNGIIPHQGTARTTESFSHPRITPDRKSTRLNSSHVKTSYAVFCLKKEKQRAT